MQSVALASLMMPAADSQLFLWNIPEHLLVIQLQPQLSPLQDAEWDWMRGSCNSTATTGEEMFTGASSDFQTLASAS